MNEKENESNPNQQREKERERELGIFSTMEFDSATFSFLALLKIKWNRKKTNILTFKIISSTATSSEFYAFCLVYIDFQIVPATVRVQIKVNRFSVNSDNRR